MNKDASAKLATRAYSAFEVKSIQDDSRTFTGWATTPAVDRMQDTIRSLGAKFKNPLVLLHQHKHDQPIGRVTFKNPTDKGIEFEAEIPSIDEPGPLKDRLDTAWGEIKHGLVRAVSIGFRPIKYSFKDDGGIDYEEIEIFELSSVSIPALPQAVITAVKSMAQLPGDGVEQIKKYDDEARHGGEFIVPAPGQNDDVAANPPATAKGQSPGVSGTQTKPAAKRGPVKLIKRNPK